MKKGILAFCVTALLLSGAADAPAQGMDGTWGIGAFADLYVPLLNFRSMYTEGLKVGASVHRTFSDRVLMEVEYHYARFDHGSLEERNLLVGELKSPDSRSKMRFNSLCVNWLLALREDGFGQKAAPYATFGAGFYDYSSKVSGLIFPEDRDFAIEPGNDTRTAVSANLGGGLLVGLGENAALDLRIRYNLVMGELRPFLVWGIEKTFPFNLVDIGLGLKFNLK